MNLQFLTVLSLVILAAVYLGRNLVRGLPGKDCSSGCGACRSDSCAHRRLARAPRPRPRRWEARNP